MLEQYADKIEEELGADSWPGSPERIRRFIRDTEKGFERRDVTLDDVLHARHGERAVGQLEPHELREHLPIDHRRGAEFTVDASSHPREFADQFVVALVFGWARERTGSIVGVSLAHGLTNIVLFLVMPFLPLVG